MIFHQIKRNRKRKAVIVQVIGSEHNNLHKITAEAQQAYAQRIGADYQVLRPKICSSPYSKSCAFGYTQYYDQCLILDVDVVPTKLAPNIFDLVPLGHWGVVDEAHMRPVAQWHSHQNVINTVLERKGIPLTYLSKLATSGVIVAPHNAEKIIYMDEMEPSTNNYEEKAWFTYNLERSKQNVIWLNDLWNVSHTDPEIDKKYPYAYFIHRNDDTNKIKNLTADIIQHIGDVHIPHYVPGGNAIVTVNFSHDPFYSSTRDSIKAYAERIGAQLIEITGTYSYGMHHCWPKYYASEVARHFDKTLYVDTDVYIDEEAPDIFKRIPNNQWCFIDESGLSGNHSLTIEYDKCLMNHQLIRKGRWQIYNAGIMVIPPHGIDIYNNQKPWQLKEFWDEQTLLNNDIVGSEFHVLDTSWNTMPFTRSTEPIKFLHVAGGSKFQNLANFLNHKFNKVLLYWPSDSIYAERLSKNIDKQICDNLILGHHNFNLSEVQEILKKYVTIVENPIEFDPDIVFYIETPIVKKLENIKSIYIITTTDLINDENIRNIKMWSRSAEIIAVDPDTATKARKNDIKVLDTIYKYNIPVPGRNGKFNEYIDPNCILIGMIYSPGDDFINAINKIKENPAYRVAVIDDLGKESPCNYRLNNIRNSGNTVGRMDVLIDLTDQNPYHPILLEAVLTRTPVAAFGMDLKIYSEPKGDIMDVIHNLRKLKHSTLENRRLILEKYLNYDECYMLWKNLLESIDTESNSGLTI